MDFLFDFLYIMGSISTLSGRSQARSYYWAHYKRRGTLKFCAVATRVSYIAASSAGRNYFLGAPSRDLFTAIDSSCSPYQPALQTFTPPIIRSSPDGATFGAKHDFWKFEQRPPRFLRFSQRIYWKPKPDAFYINIIYYSTQQTASTASRVFVQGVKFLRNRGSNYDHFFIHNSKPEVEIEKLSTPFYTAHRAPQNAI